MHKPVLATL